MFREAAVRCLGRKERPGEQLRPRRGCGSVLVVHTHGQALLGAGAQGWGASSPHAPIRQSKTLAIGKGVVGGNARSRTRLSPQTPIPVRHRAWKTT